MSKTVTAKLNPTVTTKSKAREVAAADGRKRPVVAINDEGKLVICCRRTAKTHGWTVQEALFDRKQASKPEPVVVPAPVKRKPAAKKAEEYKGGISAGPVVSAADTIKRARKHLEKTKTEANVSELLGE